jgi:predicted signal transduction protein with EAL and GGDEF domain
MYHIKSLGAGGCAVFDASMNEERFSQLELEQELRQSLAQGDFVAFFQPIVDLATGVLVGVEALARWRHSRLGWLDPSAFLALAEQAGLVPDIDALVQKSALRSVARWRELGYDLVASINCSSA